jgi:lysozyme family protein
MAVNMGHTQAHRILQRAIHANADGVFGPVTLALANSTPILLEKLCEGQASFYMGLVGRNPSQSLFLKGWLKRAAWRPE